MSISNPRSVPLGTVAARAAAALRRPASGLLGPHGHGAEVLKGSSLSLILRVLAVIFGFLFNLVVARKFGAEGAGIYGLAITVVTMCVTFALLGFDLAAVKHVAAAAAVKDWWRVRRISAWGIVIVLALSSALALAVFFARAPLADRVFGDPALDRMLQVMAVAIVPLALARLAAAYHRAVKRLVAALMSEAVLVPLVAMLIVLAAANGGIEYAGLAYAAGCAVAAVFALAMWLRVVRGDPGRRPETADGGIARGLLLAGAPMLGVTVANLSGQWITVYIVGVVGDASDVGLYRIALQIAVLIGFLLTANNSIMAPKIAALHHAGDVATIRQIWRFSVLLLMFVGVPAVALVVAFPALPLSLFGPQFVAAQAALQILALGQLVNLATGPVGLILIMTGHERLSLLISATSAVAVLAASVLLIPAYGATGAAVAFSLGQVLRNVAATYFVWKVAGIRFIGGPPA